MNGEPKIMKMPSYLKKKLKDGMIKESKSVSSKLENMFFCTTLVSDSCHSRNPSSNNYSTMHSLRPKYGEVSCSRHSHGTTKGITTYIPSKYRTHIKFT